jgi:MoxR-like ATPase
MAIEQAVQTATAGQPIAWAHRTAAEIIDNVSKVIIGKTESIKLAVITIMSGGHLLI